MNSDKINVLYIPEINKIRLVLNGNAIDREFDFYYFMKSIEHKMSSLPILTCTCGIAGCDGIFDGISIKNRKYSIEWRDIDSNLPKKFYSFNKTEYYKIVEEINEIVLNNRSITVGFSYDDLNE